MADDASGDDRSPIDDAQAERDESAAESSPFDSRGDATGPDEERDRIPIDLSDDRRSAADDGDDPEEDAYAPEPGSTPIEPGTPSLENAAFVLLGALLMLVVLFRLVTIVVG